MARRRTGERVLGPYPARKRWRVIIIGDGGERDSRFYPTEEQAKEAVRLIRREFRKAQVKTVQEARDEYELHLRFDVGDKPASVKSVIYRLEMFFPDVEEKLDALTPHKCTRYYEGLRNRKSKYGRTYAVDSHRAMLMAAKSFLKWCVVKKKWLARNPLDEVEGVGRRKHGKPQLRIDEARRWMATAQEMADAGSVAAVAAMMALLMGMRASEIVSRVVRDLDDDGQLLWIPDSKTEAGKRTLEVPEMLRPYLKKLAEGRRPEERLFGEHKRDWIRDGVQKICKLARVPIVGAHSMRGLHSTVALQRGVTAHVVAEALGHESFATTAQSYAKPGAVAAATQRRVLEVLDGGRGQGVERLNRSTGGSSRKSLSVAENEAEESVERNNSESFHGRGHVS